jgi:hypothetical protein
VNMSLRYCDMSLKPVYVLKTVQILNLIFFESVQSQFMSARLSQPTPII